MSLFGQPGTLDVTFNPTDQGFGVVSSGSISAIAYQPDGKILIAGYMYVNRRNLTVIRLNPDGSLDQSFSCLFQNERVTALVCLPNGKIMVGGGGTWNEASNIARLNNDGSIDESFNTRIGADGDIETIAIQPDGKVLIGGNFKQRLARLNVDGTIDDSFRYESPIPIVVPAISAIALAPDGKLLVGEYSKLLRLNPDGSLDESFGKKYFFFHGRFSSLVSLSDGKIMAGGDFFYRTKDGEERYDIMRLDENGNLDETYKSSLTNTGDIYAISYQPDGKLLVAGRFKMSNVSSQLNIGRLNADGSIDDTFKSFVKSSRIAGVIDGLILQPDGKVVIAGYFEKLNGTLTGVARLNSDGSFDESFDQSTGADHEIMSIAYDSSGKVLISGVFSEYNNTASNGIAQLNADGSLDDSFKSPFEQGNAVGFAIYQSDGKVLIDGLTRLHSNGSRDLSYNPPKISGFVSAAAYQADGRIVIGSQLLNLYGRLEGIARLNNDGSLDLSFNPGTGVKNQPYFYFTDIRSIVYQQGKTLIGGNFNNYNDIARNGIARLNLDGSLDTSFDPGTNQGGSVDLMVVQPDGKILISGPFSSYNGAGRPGLARINANGSLDTSFNPPMEWLSTTSMALLSDGKILVAGRSITGLRESKYEIVRLNPDGGRDTSFNPGSGPNGEVNAMVQLPEGKALIAGNFTSYNGVGRNRIARIFLNNETSFPAPSAKPATNLFSIGFTANWNSVLGATGYRLDVSADNFSTFVPGFNDKSVTSTSHEVVGLTLTTPYQYRVRAVYPGGISGNSNVIKTTTLAADLVTGDLAPLESGPSAYPNPVESMLEISGIDGELKDYQLVDLLGRPSKIILERRGDVYATSVEHLLPGMYVLRLYLAGYVHQIKFVKK